MATKHWLGIADPVAQISEGGIDTVDATPANNTFTVTIGGVSICVAGVTSAAATATALVAALNASTHPYFAAITWSVQSTDNVRGVADVPGVPFSATLSKSGAGTGTITNFGGTGTNTAASGPNDWSTAANWSDGAIPANGDTVIFKDNSVPVSWGLDQNSVALAALQIHQSYEGRIGLNRTRFATTSDGATTNAAKPEYRDTYLKISIDKLEIGQNLAPTTPAGAGRVKIDNTKAGASTTTIFNTSSAPTDTGQTSVRLKAAHASADIYVRSAPGGVGIATDAPGETSTIGKLSVSDPSTSTKVFISAGVTLTTFEQSGGTNVLQAAAAVTTVSVDGGQLNIDGDFTITTLNIDGGVVNDNHIKSSGNAITTCNLNAGTLDLQGSNQPRTIATLNPNGGNLKNDKDVVTITTINQPAGHYSLSVA